VSNKAGGQGADHRKPVAKTNPENFWLIFLDDLRTVHVTVEFKSLLTLSIRYAEAIDTSGLFVYN
jgi:hypothetical protein